MRRSFSLAVKLSGVAAVCLLAYRGAQLYWRHDITIYITEVVHLPIAAATGHSLQLQRRQQKALAHAPRSLTTTIEGKVEMEACVMRSYRFHLKLAGHVRSALFDADRLSSESPRGSRHRVLAVSPSNTVEDSSFASFNSNFASPTAYTGGAAPGGSRRGGPTLVITDVDPIVDAHEADASGVLAFTPACISEGLLCRYTCVVPSAGEEEMRIGEKSRATPGGLNASDSLHTSPSSSPLRSGNTELNSSSSSGNGSIYVRSCFLEVDGETAYGQRLTMELEFLRPVFGARVIVRLPSRHCQLLRSHTGGVGTVTQLLQQPRKCVWDIGVVSDQMCAFVPRADASTAMERMKEDVGLPYAVIPAESEMSAQAGTSSFARLELVFEQTSTELSRSEVAAADEEAEDSYSSDAEDNDWFPGSVSRASRLMNSLKRRWQPEGSSSERQSGSTTSTHGQTGSKTTATCSSGRSRKRETRARKARDRETRILLGGNSSQRTASSSEDGPKVELVFSVNALLSGTSVKKLQVVEERPNWVPRSRLDRFLLRHLIPGLEALKLKKLAHYTTWYVQPVAVSQL